MIQELQSQIAQTSIIDFKTLITVAFALIGLVITHYFTSKRDRKNKIRETNLTYVKRAYDNLNTAIPHLHAGRRKTGGEFLEKAFTDIQIHGTKDQIDSVNEIIQSLNSRSFSFDPILNSLRDHLRNELDLPKENRTILHVSFPIDDDNLAQKPINHTEELPKQ